MDRARFIVDLVQHHCWRQPARLGKLIDPHITQSGVAFAGLPRITKRKRLETVEKLDNHPGGIALTRPIESGFEKLGNLQGPRRYFSIPQPQLSTPRPPPNQAPLARLESASSGMT